MKILVTVKRVPDPESVLKVNAEGTGFVKDNLKWVVNPFDEIAVEEGLRIREKNAGTEVVLVSIGDKTAQEQLRTGLAIYRREVDGALLAGFMQVFARIRSTYTQRGQKPRF